MSDSRKPESVSQPGRLRHISRGHRPRNQLAQGYPALKGHPSLDCPFRAGEGAVRVLPRALPSATMEQPLGLARVSASDLSRISLVATSGPHSPSTANHLLPP